MQDRDGFYLQRGVGELVQTQQQQSLDDHDQIDLESVLQIMAEAAEVKVEV